MVLYTYLQRNLEKNRSGRLTSLLLGSLQERDAVTLKLMIPTSEVTPWFCGTTERPPSPHTLYLEVVAALLFSWH